MATCVVSGTFVSPQGTAVAGATVRFNIETPVLDGSGNLLMPKEITTTTAVGGTWSLTIVRSVAGTLTLDLSPTDISPIVKYHFSLVIPAAATATFAECWADSATFGGQTASSPLTVAQGGTGVTSLTLNSVLLGNGTSPVQVVVPGLPDEVLTTDGVTWYSAPAPGASGGYNQIQEEGVALTARTKLNFSGAALTAVDNAGNTRTDVTLSQSPSSASVVGTGRLLSTTAPITGGGDLSSDRTLAIPAATGLVDGYLTAANWTTFNSKQTQDADLDAIAALASTGLIARTGSGTASVRTVTGTTNRITVTNGDGVSGNPTLDVGSTVYVSGGTDVAVADGGTGASTAANARANLGVAIGSDVQAWDTDLDAIAGVSSTGVLARTGAGTASARTVTGTANRVTVTNGDGVSGNPTLDVGTNVYTVGGTDVAVADGGTGSSTAAGARTNLGVVIGTDVQAWDTDLDALAGVSSAGMLSRTGSGTASARTITGTANRITVTNGDGISGNPTLDVGSTVYVSGGTDVAVADGGTGSSTASGARTNLGLVIGTDVQAYSANILIVAPGITIDGGGSAPTTGSKGFLTLPYAGTINNWYLAADISGACVIDVKRSGTSIIGGGGNKPTLSGAISGNAAVSGWTSTAISAGDILEFNLDSASTLTRVNLVLKVTKT